jgi:hypothetical protein
MQAYPFLWLPLVIVIGIPIVLVSPYLALIVLALLLVALLAAIVAAPYLLGLYLAQRWREHRARADVWSAKSQRESA